jgi:thymidylate synthase (FAD)
MTDVLGDGISECVLLTHCGCDKDVVNAARVSYANADESTEMLEKDSKLLRYLIFNEHGSPLEHTYLRFRVKAPLYVIQEMLRHRVGVSFNQESHRYVGLGTEARPFEFYVPEKFRAQSKANKQSSLGMIEDNYSQASYEEIIQRASQSYTKLIESGVCKEQARGVLPTCTYSSLWISCNLRSLMHFVSLRDHPRAQWEIRQYAIEMKRLATQYFPESIKFFDERQGEG